MLNLYEHRVNKENYATFNYFFHLVWYVWQE